jgi:outer membrane protein assembly factor BamB/subtilisin family serine protease
MIRRLLSLVVALALAAVSFGAEPGELPALTQHELVQGFRDGYVLAKPRVERLPGVDAAEKGEGLVLHRRFDRVGGLRLLRLPQGDTASAAVRRLRKTGRYEFVEPDYVRHASAIPNDPYFGQQWALLNTGSNGPGSGIAGADISATTAWGTRTSASTVIVAVIDTGLRMTHTDIAANLWTNPQENLDGYTGDLHGINSTVPVLSVNNGNPNDDDGHGTHVAGILGAVGNNGTGISGVAWQVQIMPLKFLDSSGNGSTANEVTCIDFAISHGANLINASFGSSAYSQSELLAIQTAGNAGIIFVAAAGNIPESNDLTPSYPANYPLDNIVAVGCSDNRDDLAYFTSYGSGAVDLFAPGDSILSLYNTSDTATATLSGTSMSTPMVTGALALLKAQFPSDTYRQLINRLLSTVDAKANFRGRAQSGGRLNLAAALTSASNRPFNNAFASRAHIQGWSVTARSNNAGATREAGEPAISGDPGGASLWWEWTAPATGPVSIRTAGSSYPTLLGVYTGASLTSLNPVAVADQPGNGASAASFTATAGTTYEIATDGQSGASGLTVLNIGYANDSFSQPAVLSGPSVTVTSTNANATLETGEPRIQGTTGGHSLWYHWTAPASGQYQVSVFSPDFDTLVAVYTGSTLSSLNLVASAKGGGMGSSQLTTGSTCVCTFTATVGTTYSVTVDGAVISDNYTGLNSGQFTLTIADSSWQVLTGDSVTGAPAVGPDGSVYVGSDDGILYAVNASGATKWTYTTGSAIDTSSATVSADGSAVYASSEDGYLYAISAANGSLLWRYQLSATPACSPTLASDGSIYVKDSGSTLYAVNPTGSRKWASTVPGASYASPVVAADGTIYIGTDGGTLYAIDPSNGADKWTFSAASAIYTAVAVDASGTVYFGTLGGTVYAVDSTGRQLWSHQAASSITSSPALGSNGAVYFGCYDHNLYALNSASGAQLWTSPLGGEVRASSPTVDSNGLVYVGCYDGLVYAINPDGSLNRTYATGNLVRSSPTLAGGMLYIGSSDHHVYAFPVGAALSASAWPTYLGNSDRTGRAPAQAPVLTTSPQSWAAAAGTSITLSAAAYGTAPITYQWYLNGNAIPGATSPTLALGYAGTTQSGAYTVRAANSAGSVTSPVATVSVSYAAKLTNISARAAVGTGGNILIAGFSLAGSGSRQVLLRGVGPGLNATFGLTGILATPQLALYDGATTPLVVATDTGWGNAPVAGPSAVPASPATAPATIMAAVGAFSLAAGSADCAMLVTPPAGSFTAQLSGVNATTGIGLAEIYDADSGPAPERLSNISARASVGTGGNILIGGFSISGTTSETVLIRGVGPGLNATFGLTGILATPQLALYDGTSQPKVIATNTGWANAPVAGTSAVQAGILVATTAVMTQVGAFGLAAGSADCAMVATLPPGSYTAQLTGVNSTTGIGLIEVYEVP